MSYIGRTKTPAPLTSADIPDGIVTAADLAPDSVGTSEIADSVTLVTPNLGTVATGNLSNTAIVYPAGHVVQVKKGTATAQSTTDSTSFTSTPFKTSLDVDITPVLNNSAFFITATFPNYQSNATSYCYMDLYRNSSSTTETYNLSGYANGISVVVPANVWVMSGLTWFDDSSAMTTRGDKNTITYAISMIANANTAYLGYGNPMITHIVVMEVAV